MEDAYNRRSETISITDTACFAEIYKNNYFHESGGDDWGSLHVLMQTMNTVFTGYGYKNDELGEKAFAETCKQLNQIGWYEPILKLVVAMANLFEAHEMNNIKEILSELEIREGYTVAQFIQDAYCILATQCKRMEDINNFTGEYDNVERIIPSDFDVFNC